VKIPGKIDILSEEIRAEGLALVTASQNIVLSGAISAYTGPILPCDGLRNRLT
jgi:hypothetical protein